MSRSAVVARILGIVVCLATLTGCGGRVLWLGNAPSGSVDGGAGIGEAGVSADVGTDGGICPHAQVNANEVLWIGDSWILVPGSQRTIVRDKARAAGAIGLNDDYVNGAVAASTISAIASQYNTREVGAIKVRVLIMDGGTWDTIVSGATDATVTSVVNAFGQFLTKVASDGTVEHVIYFLPPELANIVGVAVLRPLLQQACAQSKVPCHFLDLQPLWAGHSEYTASGDLLPSEAGAAVLADAIWGIMRTNCIAQ